MCADRQATARPGIRAAVCAALLALCCMRTGAAATVNGDLQYDTFGYPKSDSDEQHWENFFEARLRASGTVSPTLTYQFEGRAVADDTGFTAGAYSLRNTSRRRPYLSLITGLLNYQPTAELRVSIGKQITNWSVFDEIQPGNLLSVRDQSDVFRGVALGIPGIALHYEPARVALDLVVVPAAFTPSRLPQGRWTIIPTSTAQEHDLPPVRFDETQAGVRLTTRVGQLDLGILGYVGRDSSPIFVSRLVFVGGLDPYKVTVLDRYPRLRAGGVTAVHPLGEQTLVRAESVYYNSPDTDRDDFLQSVVGVEYARGNWRGIANYFRDDQTLRAPQEVTDKGGRRFFQSFIYGEARYDARRRLRARLRAGYDFTEQFLLIQPEISYRVWGQVRVALLADVIDAAGSRPVQYFYGIRHEDRLGMRVEYDL